MKYKIISGNAGVVGKEADVVEFFKEFNLLFYSRLMPSHQILNSLSTKDDELSNRMVNNLFDWQPFEISFAYYTEIKEQLIHNLNLHEISIPDDVDTLFKWEKWQLQYLYGIPYEKNLDYHYKMAGLQSQIDDVDSDNNEEQTLQIKMKLNDLCLEHCAFIRKYRNK